MLKNLAKQWLPPIATNFIESSINARKHKHYPSYAEAFKHCSQGGYENTVLIDVVTYKMRRFLDTAYKNEGLDLNPMQTHTILAISKLMATYPNRTEFNILDFGGGLGGHYFETKKLLGDKITLHWAVVETPAMAAAGKGFVNDELQFYDDIHVAQKALGAVDLLHTSGTLQCVDAPFDFLKLMMDAQAPFMLFNRLGLNRLNKTVVTIHHSKLSWNGFPGLPPGVEDRVVSYPFTFISEADFMARVAEKYRVVARFADGSGIFPVPDTDLVGLGLLVELKK
jgi:putative methyltransferase (TIGR04325 family)